MERASLAFPSRWARVILACSGHGVAALPARFASREDMTGARKSARTSTVRRPALSRGTGRFLQCGVASRCALYVGPSHFGVPA